LPHLLYFVAALFASTCTACTWSLSFIAKRVKPCARKGKHDFRENPDNDQFASMHFQAFTNGIQFALADCGKDEIDEIQCSAKYVGGNCDR
jgi:hypothetical protein